MPFTDKEELREAQQRAYPFGDHLACGPERLIRLHRTSGTTGRALNLANTRRDAEVIAAVGGRAAFASGLRPGDRIVHCLNYCLWIGGVTDHLSLEAAGATVIPFGVGSSRQLIEIIRDLSVTAIQCTPSYPALLETVIGESGIVKRPAELGLRLGLFGGEAGLDNAGFRARLEEVWGFKVRNANYGLSEVLSTFGSQCETSNDLHFHGGDALFAEIVEPSTGQRVPLAEGRTGELVCTHLRKEAQPLIRYRSRDVVTVTASDACACGRTGWRFRVVGRTDDMFNVRGVNVFPTAIQAVLLDHPALTSGHFRIRLAGRGPYDRIDLRVEASGGSAEEDWPRMSTALEAAIRSRIGATAKVTLLADQSLPRTEGKTRWVERTE